MKKATVIWKMENTRMSVKGDSTAILRRLQLGGVVWSFNEAVDGELIKG